LDDKGEFDTNKVKNYMTGNIIVQDKVEVFVYTHMAFDQAHYLFTKKDTTP